MTEQTLSERPSSEPAPGTLTTPPPKTVWPCLNYRDAHGAIRFLVEAFGFVETLVVPGEAEGSVVHAELRWPEGGGVMLGSADHEGGDNPFAQLPAGVGNIYVVTDQPDALLARATAAGAELVRGMEDTDYGSRGFTVRDPQGVLWSFGTYAGT